VHELTAEIDQLAVAARDGATRSPFAPHGGPNTRTTRRAEHGERRVTAVEWGSEARNARRLPGGESWTLSRASVGLVACAAAFTALGIDQAVYLTVATLDVGADFLF
jgi:hypothetical protein